MNNKILIGIIILFIGIFTVSVTVVNANIADFLCPQKQTVTVILTNNADLNKAKANISKIPKIKIVSIQDRNKEWSDMVNKMDLPKMDNPFKNEMVIKINKNANTDEITKTIKSMDFVESIEINTNK